MTAVAIPNYAQRSLSAGFSVSPALNIYHLANLNFNDANFTYSRFSPGISTGIEVKAELNKLLIESGFNINLFSSKLAFDKADVNGVSVYIYAKNNGYMYTVPVIASYPIKHNSGRTLIQIKLGANFNYAIKSSGVEMGMRQQLTDRGFIESSFVGKHTFNPNFTSIVLGVGKTIASKKGKEIAFNLMYSMGMRELLNQNLTVNVNKNQDQQSYSTVANLKQSSLILKIAYYPLKKTMH